MPDQNQDERRYAEFYRRYASDFSQDVRVYLDLAAKWPGAVLEVGCRTGRVAHHLAKAGYEVLAIDTSRPMLERAVDELRDAGDKVRVADFDLRRQPTPERHSVALATLFAFNDLIDVEEQRLFLRHLRRSMSSPGVAALDLFCPLSLARPEEAHQPREVKREVGGHVLRVLDEREMLTPLLERRTRTFSTDGGKPGRHVTHRRYITPSLAGSLMTEAGFGNVQWVRGYDLSTAEPISDDARPSGPFLVLGEL
jgi:SAM-dependent methyltransferase